MRFENWWYYNDHQNIYNQMKQFGIVKSEMGVKVYRVLTFIFMTFFSITYLFVDGPQFFFWLTNCGQALTTVVFGIGCFEVPTGRAEKLADKYRYSHAWKWLLFLNEVALTWEVLITVYYWALIYDGPRVEESWII